MTTPTTQDIVIWNSSKGKTEGVPTIPANQVHNLLNMHIAIDRNQKSAQLLEETMQNHGNNVLPMQLFCKWYHY